MTPTIRLAGLEDAEALHAVYAPYCLTPISFESGPPGAAEMAARIGRTLPTHPWIVCEAGGEVIGYAYAGPHRDRAAYRWSADTSVYIDARRVRRGVGRALYTALFGALRVQGFVNAYAGVTLPNPASVGLHESMGFVPVGVYRSVGFKSGRWHDVAWYQRPIQAPPDHPDPPRAVAEAAATAEWAAALSAGIAMLTIPN